MRPSEICYHQIGQVIMHEQKIVLPASITLLNMMQMETHMFPTSP